MQLNFTYNFRATLPWLVLTIFIVLSRPRTIPFCYEIYQPPPLGWSTYGTMSMQISRYSATFVSTSLGTPSRAKKQFLYAKAIKVCPVFPNLCKAKGVTFRTFLLPVLLRPHRLLDIVSVVAYLSRRVTLLFCSEIYRSRKFPSCFIPQTAQPD